ncbi:MAG: SctK family type III secretion system sorting platform protein [Candidimonas sp.]
MNLPIADGVPRTKERPVSGNGGSWRPEVMMFNLMPSLTLHPERRSQFSGGHDWSFVGDTNESHAIMHRHWSRSILKALRLEERFVEDADSLALRVALLPADELDRLARWLGIRLCAVPFRTAIRGEDVRRMMGSADAHEIETLRQSADELQIAFYEPARGWSVEQALANYAELGVAALLHACEPAGEALGIRLALKLAPAGYWDAMPDGLALQESIALYMRKGAA